MVSRRHTLRGILSTLAIWPLRGFLKTDSLAMQETPDQLFFELDKVYDDLKQSRRPYNSFLNVPKLNSGLYVLEAGKEDKQSPHELDEVYYVISGNGKFRSGNDQTKVSTGSILYVKAGVEHRFFDVEEELKILVFFSEMK